MKFNMIEEMNAKDAWLKQVKHHRRRLKGLPRIGFNPNAGNVEYNISMLNKMLGSGEMLSVNPVSGPFGGDASGAGIGESLIIENNLLENIDMNDNKVRKAVGVLFDMDNFILSVEDNMYWLAMGVPDGEFDEADRHAAEVNFADHDWLIVDDDKFDTESFKDLLDAFEKATDDNNYDKDVRDAIIKEAKEILNMNESWEEDEFETDERYFIYDENDNCVSDGYKYIDKAISTAQEADYPVIKVHAYFRDENGKLQPNGDPEVIWAAGEYVAESYDKDGNHEKCEECGALLNDMGECPRCKHGEEDLDEKLVKRDGKWEVRSEDGSKILGTHDTKEEAEKQLQAIHINQHEALNEDTLTEGPFDKIKQHFKSKKDIETAANVADVKERNNVNSLIKNIGKILAPSYKDKSLEFYIDGKWVDYDEFVKECPANTVAAQAKDEKLSQKNISNYPELAKAINAVVRNNNGYIVRRGLEILKDGDTPFNPTRSDLLQVKKGYRAEDVIGKYEDKASTTGAEEEPKQPTNTEEPKAEEPVNQPAGDATNPVNPNEPTVTDENPDASGDKAGKKPAGGNLDWVTNQSIKAAITLRAKRKDGSAAYYTKDGQLFDYRDIDVNNINDIYLDKEGKVSFMDLMNETKKNYARRKKAIERNAAMFGESYDDSMEYDLIEEQELDEAMSAEEAKELMQLAKEIGLKTGKELNDFASRETYEGESVLDALRRYRNDLGDDFELKENYQYSPNSVVENHNDDLDDSSFAWYNI